MNTLVFVRGQKKWIEKMSMNIISISQLRKYYIFYEDFRFQMFYVYTNDEHFIFSIINVDRSWEGDSKYPFIWKQSDYHDESLDCESVNVIHLVVFVMFGQFIRLFIHGIIVMIGLKGGHLPFVAFHRNYLLCSLFQLVQIQFSGHSKVFSFSFSSFFIRLLSNANRSTEM